MNALGAHAISRSNRWGIMQAKTIGAKQPRRLKDAGRFATVADAPNLLQRAAWVTST